MRVVLDPIVAPESFEKELEAEIAAWFEEAIFKPLFDAFEEERPNAGAYDPNQLRDRTGKWSKSGGVNWDVKGIGSIPYQVDIDYYGFTRKMTPEEFLALVPPGVSGANTKDFIVEEIKKGTPIAPPYLRVKWVEDKKAWQIMDHEGRSRSRAAPSDKPMPVSIKPEDFRARDLTPEMIAAPLIAQEWSYGIRGAETDNERENAETFGALIAAVRSGRVSYANGVFSGKFSSEISKQLRSIGAKFDKGDKTYRVAAKEIPLSLRGVLSDAKARSEALHVAIEKRTVEIAANVAASPTLGLRLESFTRRLLANLDEQFRESITNAAAEQKAIEFVATPPDFSPSMVNDVREMLTENLTLSIKDFTEEETLKVRELAEENWIAGGRVDRLREIIEDRFGVSERKAAFLARQETSMIASEFARARAQEIGSTEYVWFTRHDDRVRHDHQELNGTTQRWDDPPIVDRAHDRRANPGMDWNCRCVPRPVLNVSASRVYTPQARRVA